MVMYLFMREDASLGFSMAVVLPTSEKYASEVEKLVYVYIRKYVCTKLQYPKLFSW